MLFGSHSRDRSIPIDAEMCLLSNADVQKRLIQIWIFLVASMTATILCLYGISHVISEFMKNSNRRNDQAHLGKLFEDIGRAFQYVVGVILSQGKLSQKFKNSHS